jgi:purine-binding chemotaxis protein CheW
VPTDDRSDDLLDGGQSQFLTFATKCELYAIEVLRVREIVRYDNITAVPYAAAWVRGVMNLRGNVVPVVDLAVRFGLPASDVDRKTCVLIVETEIDGRAVTVGLLADGVHDVISVATADIEPPPALGTRAWPEFLIGLAPAGDHFAQILDVVSLLANAAVRMDAAAPEAVAV